LLAFAADPAESFLWTSTISRHERSNYYCRVEKDE
jgi:hypothetical protein